MNNKWKQKKVHNNLSKKELEVLVEQLKRHGNIILTNADKGRVMHSYPRC